LYAWRVSSRRNLKDSLLLFFTSPIVEGSLFGKQSYTLERG
jgi:hypothetical protein